MAYDELNNPTSHGIWDEAMGVSALDKLSKWKTWGCDSTYCPGHMGHIKLTSTCYNPFTMKLLHKLLKSKCMVCHRLRIFPKKIELFEIRLKLIKLGYLVEAEKLSDYNDFSLDSIDSSIRMLRKKLNVKSTSKEEKEDEEEADIEQKHDTLVALEGIREKEKENREIFYSEISSILQEGTPNGIIGNAITVAFKNITKEILSSIIPSKCPHCEARNPRVRKDGATKFFQMPLSNKDTKAMMSSHGRTDMRIDISTMAAISEYDEEDEEESKDESMAKEGEEEPDKKQKYLNPIEVREHMKRLWEVENTLLNELFNDYTIFFMNNLLVSPNRFRPESSGGSQSGDDRDYLHAHSAMLTKIINTNLAFRRTIEVKEHLVDDKNQDKKGDKSKTEQIDLSKTEITSKEVIKAWAELQESINCYLDSSLASKLENKEKPGLRQLLEK